MPRPRSGPAARLLAVLLLLAAAVGPTGATAQPQAEAPVVYEAAIEALAGRTQRVIDNPEVAIEILDGLRSELVAIRSSAHAAELTHAPAAAELRRRIETLGPPPDADTPEAPEVAHLRRELNAQLAAAQAPLVVAQQAARRANSLIADIDRVTRARITSDRFGHRPSPLLPSTWIAATREIGGHAAAGAERAGAFLADAGARDDLLRRLPLALLIGLAGYLVAFTMRRSIGAWIESGLAAATDHRSIGRMLFLRGLNRFVPPLVGIMLLFAAIDLALFGGQPSARELIELLPAWVLALIVAAWLAGTFFAPNAPAFRIAPLETQAARAAGRLTLFAGVLLALRFLFEDLVAAWQLSLASRSALAFLPILLGAYLIWRAARLIDHIAAVLVESTPEPAQVPPGEPAEETGGRIGSWLLRLLARGLRVIAVLAPPLAAVGYVGGADFFVRGALMSLALLAAAVVLHDLLSRMLASFFLAPDAEGGLIPVFVALLVILACLPLLALVWGARISDIRDVWALLADGTTVGGITISLDVLLTFVIAFGVVVAITRLIQALLVSTVLPRTRLDSGAREAARAGVGYVGFALAAVAGVGAAGLDLSSLALVAGALSVGIGFGLQAVVSNFVSGIILLVERPIKPGDWIEVGGHLGYVRGIRVRSTEIETFDRASVIIPNSDLIAGVVLNRTHIGMAGRLIVPVSVAIDSDPRQVERILLEIADAHPVVLDDPPPAVVFMSFGADGLAFELRCRLRDVNFILTVRSDVNHAILERFRDEGIAFAFPQRVVHFPPETAPELPRNGPPDP